MWRKNVWMENLRNNQKKGIIKNPFKLTVEDASYDARAVSVFVGFKVCYQFNEIKMILFCSPIIDFIRLDKWM